MNDLLVENKKEQVLLSDMLNMKSLDSKYAFPAAKELVNRPEIYPVANNLQLSRLPKDEQIKSLAAIIAIECCCNQVPLQLFCKGAWRPSSSQKISYHSEYALHILRHIADKNDLPKIKNFYYQFILSDNELVFKLQPLYRMLNVLISMGKKNDRYIDLSIDKFLNQIEGDDERNFIEIFIDREHIKDSKRCRFIKMHTKNIYAWKQEVNPELLIMCGTYELNGVDGYLVDSNNEKFEYTYLLSPIQTKVASSNGESAFSKSPVQFLKTKFMRHISVQYYKTCTSGSISILDLDDVNDEPNDQAVQNRMATIASRIPTPSIDELPKWQEYDIEKDEYIEENYDGCIEGTN